MVIGVLVWLMLMLVKRKHKHTPEPTLKYVRIALVSANFGNYRNELETFQEACTNSTFDSNIDCFLFSEHDIHIPNWRTIHFALPESSPKNALTQNPSRLATKTVKFGLPDPLTSYDFIVWMDTKLVVKAKNGAVLKYLPSHQSIVAFLDGHADHSIFLMRHGSARTTAEEELKTTMRLGVEDKIAGQRLLNEIQNNSARCQIPLPDLAFFGLRTSDEVCFGWRTVLQQLLSYGLKRDQNLINKVLQEARLEKVVHFFEPCEWT